MIQHYLVVDDDDDSRKMIVEYLRTLGIDKITEAKDGLEGALLVERDPTITFVVSDWDMPKLNGLGFLQRIRNNSGRSHLPFLIATSPISHEAEKIMLAAEHMVDAYIIKPFKLDLLKSKIEMVLQSSTPGARKVALVVDDDRDAREMIIEYLRVQGFQAVTGVEDGKSALDYLAQNHQKIGLIVSDWEMPEMSGIELLRACKMTKDFAEIPFLMVTSQSSMEKMKVMQAAKANVDEYLLKPFSSNELKTRVESVLQRSLQRRRVDKILFEAAEHMDRGRVERARELFEDALTLDALCDTAMRGLGEALYKSKGIEAGLPHFKKALDTNANEPKNFLRLALAFEQLGLVDRAVLLLEGANAQISFNPHLHFQLGRLYNKRGQTDKAREEFEKTLEIQLDYQEARLMLELLNQKA